MKKTNVSKMVGIALMMAMIVVLKYIGGLIPSVSGVSFSLVLIPIVLGAATYGVGAGAILGLTFAVLTIINCVNHTDIGGAMVFDSNPVLCIIVVLTKSVLCGIAAATVYRALSKHNTYLAMLCAAIVCPVVNTGVFITCLALFFDEVLVAWAAGKNVVLYVLEGLLLCNFVPELLINVVFSPAGSRILRVVHKNN